MNKVKGKKSQNKKAVPKGGKNIPETATDIAVHEESDGDEAKDNKEKENGEGDENKRVTEKSTKRKVKAEEGDEKKSVKGKKNASKKGKENGDETEDIPRRSGRKRKVVEETDNEVKKDEKAAKKVTKKSTKKPTKKAKEESDEEDKNSSDDHSNEEMEETKVAKRQKDSIKHNEEAETSSKNQTHTNYNNLNFECTKKNSKDETATFKISSWNVDGMRAWIKKDGIKFIEIEDPDIICLQEIKCNKDNIPSEMENFKNYKAFWCDSAKKGYAGVGILSKLEPISVAYGIKDEEHDDDGRCITAEYEEFYVISVYVTNAGKGLITLPKRLLWNDAFKNYIKKLDKKKPVIICGDMNVAHSEIDLKNPKTNKKTAGFTTEERNGMTEFLAEGFVDTYRKLYPDETDVYTFWSYMRNARAKNIGWRLDYFLVSERFMENICDNVVRDQIFGSDHCPITLFMCY